MLPLNSVLLFILDFEYSSSFSKSMWSPELVVYSLFSLIINEKQDNFHFLFVGFSHFVENCFLSLSSLNLVCSSFHLYPPVVLDRIFLIMGLGFFLAWSLNTDFWKLKGIVCKNSSKRQANKMLNKYSYEDSWKYLFSHFHFRK